MRQAKIEGIICLVMRWSARSSATIFADGEAVMVRCEVGLWGLGGGSEGVLGFSVSAGVMLWLRRYAGELFAEKRGSYGELGLLLVARSTVILRTEYRCVAFPSIPF